MSGEVFPRRRFGVETLRAPSFPLVAPPLGFPRYRAPEGALKRGIGSLADSLIGVLSGALPYILIILIRQGAKRRAAVAVSGEAAVQSANQPIQLISRRSVGAPTSLRFPFSPDSIAMGLLRGLLILPENKKLPIQCGTVWETL